MYVLLLAAIVAYAEPEAQWRTDTTDHFVIHHENPASVLGDYNRIERLYVALHDELWSLVPWIDRRKATIFVYRDRASYGQGQFHPPGWSGGQMTELNGEKVLAIFQPIDTVVTAHELTHMYMRTYFDENHAPAPIWLDEGLASMLQDETLTLRDPRDKGPVLSALIPMRTFLQVRPEADTPAASVTAWYRQAHSVVRFIKRGHIEGKFVRFCEKLRDGSDAETALREIYGYTDLDAFEADWKRWRPKREIGAPAMLGD